MGLLALPDREPSPPGVSHGAFSCCVWQGRKLTSENTPAHSRPHVGRAPGVGVGQPDADCAGTTSPSLWWHQVQRPSLHTVSAGHSRCGGRAGAQDKATFCPGPGLWQLGHTRGLGRQAWAQADCSLTVACSGPVFPGWGLGWEGASRVVARGGDGSSFPRPRVSSGLSALPPAAPPPPHTKQTTAARAAMVTGPRPRPSPPCVTPRLRRPRARS